MKPCCKAGFCFFEYYLLYMDILKKITDLQDRDIIISLPKDRSWSEYIAYFIKLKANSQTLDIIVGSVPKTIPGKRCYIIYGGLLRGYMEINRLTESEDNEIIVELIPYIKSIAHKIPMSEIDNNEEGYKYYFDNSGMQ